MTLQAVGRFVLRRLLGLVVLLVILSFLVFSLAYLAPGNVIDALLGQGEKPPQVVAAITREYNLDRPFMVQYLLWLKAALHLDLGQSIIQNMPVAQVIAERMPVTLYEGIYGFIISVVAGLVLGISAAWWKSGAIDRGVVGVTIFGVSAPTFATGLLLLWIFSVEFGWFPAIGAGDPDFVSRFWHLTLPAVSLGITGMAMMTRMTRAALIEALSQDYIGFARSRGVGSVRILFVYGLRNSLVPILTAAGIVIATTLTGSVLIEQTFSLQGIGQLLITSITNKDIPVVQGTTLLIAAFVVVINTLVDLSYVLVDPRMRNRGVR